MQSSTSLFCSTHGLCGYNRCIVIILYHYCVVTNHAPGLRSVPMLLLCRMVHLLQLLDVCGMRPMGFVSNPPCGQSMAQPCPAFSQSCWESRTLPRMRQSTIFVTLPVIQRRLSSVFLQRIHIFGIILAHCKRRPRE